MEELINRPGDPIRLANIVPLAKMQASDATPFLITLQAKKDRPIHRTVFFGTK